ncbi:hypothetical protein BCV70DRAFT_233933 [Testicularia cyperi]|uniref:PH domain-containing protein n=1 Tax=Testicularia cyperi TaxID=1882483 RepID=A0A317XGM4_9BASI|nr:hypothetical protein BCV70DRAFT_233933 [Testicularia cyperi]
MERESFDMKMPRYEGYLYLADDGSKKRNTTSAATIAQTINAESSQPQAGWIERWCSLEAGKILVYPDRTAAIVRPEDTCALIDVCKYDYIETFTSFGRDALGPWQLTLSRQNAHMPSTSQLNAQLSGHAVESLAYGIPFEASSRPSSSFTGRRASLQRSYLSQADFNAGNGCSAAANSRDSLDRNKPWVKFASGSRKLYRLVSGSSNSGTGLSQLPNGSQYQQQPSSVLDDQPLSPPSDVASRSSHSGYSSMPSPVTPRSHTFAQEADAIDTRITLRAQSASALTQWTEALSGTIKAKLDIHAATLAPVSHGQRGPTRPALSGLPGFRSPVVSSNGRTFSGEGLDVDLEGFGSVKSVKASNSRRRQTSLSSLSSGFERISAVTGLPVSGSELLQRRQNRSLHQSADLTDLDRSAAHGETSRSASAVEPLKTPLTGRGKVEVVQTPSRHSSEACRPSRHGRTGSLASSLRSSFGVAALRGTDHSRTSSASMLRSASGEQKEQDASTSVTIVCAESTNPTRAVPPARDVGGGDALHESQSRHRRSGSLLHYGSARIMAWREGASSNAVPLAIDVCGGIKSAIMQEEAEAARGQKERKSLAKLKSFHFRPTSSAGRLEPVARTAELPQIYSAEQRVSLQTNGNTRGGIDKSPNPPKDMLDAALGQPCANAASSRSISRASSFLNISNIGFGRQSHRSLSRQGSASPLASSEPFQQSSSPCLGVRLEPDGCDFSYELLDQDIEDGLAKSDVTDHQITASTNLPVENPKSLASFTTPFTRKLLPGRPDISPIERLVSFKASLTPSPAKDPKGLSARDSPPVYDSDQQSQEPEERLVDALSQSPPSSSPPLVERILPPEEMINTFDRLRAVDPSGRAREQLGASGSVAVPQFDYGGLGLINTEPGPISPFLRPSSTQSFATDTAPGRSSSSTDRSSTSPWLRVVSPAWDNQAGLTSSAVSSIGRVTADREQVVRASRNSPRPRLPFGHQSFSCPGDENQQPAVTTSDGTPMLRSLPAPPRASKRKAQITAHDPRPVLAPAAELAERAATSKPALLNKVPFQDSTNSSLGLTTDSLVLDDKMTKAAFSSSPRSRSSPLSPPKRDRLSNSSQRSHRRRSSASSKQHAYQPDLLLASRLANITLTQVATP